MAGQWAVFEKAHGGVTAWTLTGEKSVLLPSFVDKTYSVRGRQGTSGSVTLQMTQIKGSWQVARLTVAN